MSFGFSVSDIVLVSQLAYKLYGILTTGQKDAPSSFTELTDALFGLNCALNHLSHHATEISPSTSVADLDANKLLQDLKTMIKNCKATLDSLKAILDKYVDNVPVAPGTVGKRQALKRTMAVTFSRAKWMMEEEKKLVEVRGKLQSHTTAIDLILNTSLLASTQEIRTAFQTTSDKTEEMYKIMLNNSDNPKLIKEIHQLLLKLQQSHQAPNPSSAHIADHRADRDAGEFSVAYYVSSGDQENKLQSRTAPHTYNPTIPAIRSIQSEDQGRVPVIRDLSNPLPYHTRQIRLPPTLPASPTLWLQAFESSLTEGLTSVTTSLDDKRSRNLHIIEALTTLNLYLSSIQDKASRQDLRRQLEEGGAVARVFEKAQKVYEGSVVLRKLIETYEDDKAEDDIKEL